MQWMDVDLYEVRWTAGFSRKEAAVFAGVDPKTFREYERRHRAPVAIARLFGMLAGDLGMVSPQWQRWRVVSGELITPSGIGFRPGEIASLPMLVALVGALKQEMGKPAHGVAADYQANIRPIRDESKKGSAG